MPELPALFQPSWPLRVDVGGDEPAATEVRRRLATSIARAGGGSGIKVLEAPGYLVAAAPSPLGVPPVAGVTIGVAIEEVERARHHLTRGGQGKSRWLLVTPPLARDRKEMVAAARSAGVAVVVTEWVRPRAAFPFALPERLCRDLFWYRLALKVAESYRRTEL